jgi:hypothetical protein
MGRWPDAISSAIVPPTPDGEPAAATKPCSRLACPAACAQATWYAQERFACLVDQPDRAVAVQQKQAVRRPVERVLKILFELMRTGELAAEVEGADEMRMEAVRPFDVGAVELVALGGPADVDRRDLAAAFRQPDHHHGIDVLRLEKVVVELGADQTVLPHPVLVGQDAWPPLFHVPGGVRHVVQRISLLEIGGVMRGPSRIDPASRIVKRNAAAALYAQLGQPAGRAAH